MTRATCHGIRVVQLSETTDARLSLIMRLDAWTILHRSALMSLPKHI